MTDLQAAYLEERILLFASAVEAAEGCSVARPVNVASQVTAFWIQSCTFGILHYFKWMTVETIGCALGVWVGGWESLLRQRGTSE